MTNHSYKTILTKFSDENKDLIIKLFIEPFAILITCLLQNTKISANHITIFNLIISISFLALAFLIDFIFLIIGIFIFFVLDFVDGKIARIKNQSSFIGKRLDFLTDRIVFILYSFFIFYFQQEMNLFNENLLLFIYFSMYIFKDLFEQSEKILHFESEEIKNQSNQSLEETSIRKYFLNLKSLIPTRVSSPLAILLIYFIFNDLKIAYLFGCIAIYAKNFTSLIKRL